ncbi:MAG: single-stranded-DNA-specific exonuclease RecJ [Paludibacteraceae bacterium]|nr:single-stranded-DNA-specific exonuclease RecJ [Paludibacteraceae bacterium]
MQYEWLIRQLNDSEQETQALLARELKISPLSARILVDRGILTPDEARRFVRPSIQELHDPFLMRDMEQAVLRLHTAIERRERIMVYGDYDVDGTTAVALMYSFLRHLTDNLIFYIPDRHKEGYGISFQGIDVAQQEGCTLVVALDCGIKAVDKINYANERKIDFIICDHHTPGDTLPAAKAVLNMKRQDCSYPFKELSGCGVGFKLAQAYTERYCLNPQWLYNLLGLTAMSIASDVVPVTGENRILATFGLRQLNRLPSIGIRAIMQVAGIADKPVNIQDLVFKLGPRINAAGRMHSGAEAVRLLITDDPEYAQRLAQEIDSHNTERRDCDIRTTEEALQQLQSDPDNDKKHTTVVYAPNWHRGVVGIAASRLTETYYRPTIVLTAEEEGGELSGSARSVSDFDIYSAIDSCSDLLSNFGGHRFAAGLSMAPQNLPEFRRRFEEYVAAHIHPEQMKPTIDAEAEIDFADITPEFFNLLRHLEPFGPGNPRPVFVTRNVINNRGTRRVGRSGEHLRLDLTDRTAAISGIAFGEGDKALYLQNGNPIDLCYELEENTFNHMTSIQLRPLEIRLLTNND